MRATLDTALLLPYIYVAGHRFKVPTLSIRHWVELSVGVVILAAVLAIRLSMTEHPQVTRQQAIQAALKYGNGQPHPRVVAKYMRYSDLAAAQGDSGLTGPNGDFVWVVAVSSHYGISPHGKTTWGIAVVRDEAWTETSPVFEGGIKGDWPPFFDALPDLAKGQK